MFNTTSPEVAHNLTQTTRDEAVMLEGSSSVDTTLLDAWRLTALHAPAKNYDGGTIPMCKRNLDIHLPSPRSNQLTAKTHPFLRATFLLPAVMYATYSIWLGAQAWQFLGSGCHRKLPCSSSRSLVKRRWLESDPGVMTTLPLLKPPTAIHRRQ